MQSGPSLPVLYPFPIYNLYVTPCDKIESHSLLFFHAANNQKQGFGPRFPGIP